MASVTRSKDPSKSGIRKLSNGDSIIPASTRPDGSVRKEIRVKPGYKPPEDVEVYKNKTAAAFNNRGKGGVPGAAKVVDDKDTSLSAAANKNAKRREARKKAAATATDGAEELDGDHQGNGHAADDNKAATTPSPDQLDPEAEAVKEARKLTKKLRQARELKDKKEKGDSLLPEQFAKVIKISELIRQLDNLGFDTEGEKQAHSEATAG